MQRRKFIQNGLLAGVSTFALGVSSFASPALSGNNAAGRPGSVSLFVKEEGMNNLLIK